METNSTSSNPHTATSAGINLQGSPSGRKEKSAPLLEVRMNSLTQQPDSQISTNEDWLNFSNWKDVSLIAGGISLAMYALSRRNPLALLAGGAGAFIAARTASNWIERQDNLPLDSEQIESVSRAVTIKAPPEQVMDHVLDFSLVPQFLKSVKLVNKVSETRAIWTFKTGPLSNLLDVSVQRPGVSHLHLAFVHHDRPVGDADIHVNEGARTGDTRISIRLRYHAMLAGLVEGLVRPLLILELDNYLWKLKQLIETGEVARSR